MLNEEKAAQVAHYFACMSGRQINVLKLMKLMYLSDRSFIQQFGRSITKDHFVSMNNGPVLSGTLDLMNGARLDQKVWNSLLSDKANHNISSTHYSYEDHVGALSKAELKVMASVWDEFGEMNQWQLVEYTHKHCSEWEDPSGSAKPIHFSSVLKATGHDVDSVSLHDFQRKRDCEIEELFATL